MDPFWTPSLEDIKQYFSHEEWTKLTDYDKNNYVNILENYNIMVDLDMAPQEPDFIKAWKNNSAPGNTKNAIDMEIVDEIKQINKDEENKPVGHPAKSTDIMPTADSAAKKAKGIKRQGRKRKTTSAPVLEGKEMSVGTSPSEHSASTFEVNQKQPNKSNIIDPFTQEEILEAVILDNTVGALYDYCLSDLFKEHCVIEENTVSTSSGPKPSSAVKIKAENPDSILKYLADLGFTKEKLSEDHKHIYCSPCQRFYDFFCPRGHRVPIRDLPSDPPGTPAQFPQYLAIGNSGIPEAGVGVWSTAVVEKGVVWGPFKDTIIPEISDNERERRTAQDRIKYLLKDFAIIKRTWNTLINCARHERERNLVWFKHKEEVYYKVCKRIPQATEVLMFYTKEDMEKMGVDTCQFSNAKLEVPRIGIVVECKRCSSLFSNSRFILRHNKVCAPELPNGTGLDKSVHILEPNSSIEKEVCEDKPQPLRNIIEKVKQDTFQNYDPDIAEVGNSKDNILMCTLLERTCKANNPANEGEQKLKSEVNGKVQTDGCGLKGQLKPSSGERPFTCDIYNKGCTMSGSLATHKRTHTRERPFTCDICSKGFTQSGHLATHKRTHTGEKPFTCDICSKGFTVSGHLATHKRTHTGERPFTCDICSKGCTTSGSLATHKRTHTGEKPFTCDICSKGCTTSGNLETHKRTHTGERPFTCDICSQGFTQSGNLETHKRTHTGERPFTCDICSQGFTTSGNLATHKRRHH